MYNFNNFNFTGTGTLIIYVGTGTDTTYTSTYKISTGGTENKIIFTDITSLYKFTYYVILQISERVCVRISKFQIPIIKSSVRLGCRNI